MLLVITITINIIIANIVIIRLRRSHSAAAYSRHFSDVVGKGVTICFLLR